MECAIAEDVAIDLQAEFQWEFCEKGALFLGRSALHFIVSADNLFMEPG